MMSNLVRGWVGHSTESYHRPRRRGGSLIAATALMSLFFAGAARATTYYVDKTTGSDSNAGTSISTAWTTIGKANATLKAGDTVYVRAGTYNEIIEPYQSGASGAPITYQNYQGETVTVRGETGQPNIVAIGAKVNGTWNAKSYVVVDGFTIRHINPTSTSSRPILVFVNDSSSSYNVIRNCTIQGQGTPTWARRHRGLHRGLRRQAYHDREQSHFGYAQAGHLCGRASLSTPPSAAMTSRLLEQHVSISAPAMGRCSIPSSRTTYVDHSLCEDGIQFEHQRRLCRPVRSTLTPIAAR